MFFKNLRSTKHTETSSAQATRSTKIILTLTTILVITSCTTSLQLLSNEGLSLKTKGGYKSYLALEYLSFSRRLLVVKHKNASDYFAKKGLKIAAGEEFVPENPMGWKADLGQMEEMILMQKRLENILHSNSHVTFYLPIQTAHLSYLYDCWISRESKVIFRNSELAECRERFVKLLDEIEHYIVYLKKDKTPKVEIKEPEFERFEILFDFNNFKLNDRASKELVKILKYLKTLNGDFRILLVGNADRAGLELYNQNIALDRADVIKNYLIKNGVAKDLVELRSVGEDFPDIITKDGMQQQVNRTVGIYFLNGQGSFSSYPLPLLENIVYREEIRRAREQKGLKR